MKGFLVLLAAAMAGCGAPREEAPAREEPPRAEAREETAEEVLELLRKSAESWAEFGPGSWVQYHSQTTGAGRKMDFRTQTALLSRDEKSVVLEQRDLRKASDDSGREWLAPGDKAKTSKDEPVRIESLREVGREDVEAAGKRIPCRVFEAQVSSGTNRAVQKMWFACDPSLEPRVVRSESIWRLESGQESSRGLALVLEFARPVDVAGKEVRAWRTRLAFAASDGSSHSVGELVSSREVPGGYIRYATIMTFGTFENTVLTDVIGFSVIPR